MAASSTLPTLSRLVPRVDPRQSGARVTWVVAPAGYGKSALLSELTAAAAGAGRAVAQVSVAHCEGHLGLFLDALARALRQALPSVDVRPLLAGTGGVHGEAWLSEALDAVLGGEGLLLLLDDAHVLAHGEPLTR
ncbi:MAG: helix-turn-helix transcriptional regulator, partial [Deltaproteobacteria bacterium]